VDVEQLLDHKLEQMPGMTLGQLDNGLRYVILPNKVPPNRFEAHLEMHVGERVGALVLP
jgi:predicted Zn-dependent peptidase